MIFSPSSCKIKVVLPAIFLRCLVLVCLSSTIWPERVLAQYKKELAAAEVKQSLAQVSPDAIKAHMTYLADDLLEGRKPGTRGFDLAAKYMATQFQALGLQPGINGQSFLQPVQIRKGEVQEVGSSFEIVRNGQEKSLVYGQDFFMQPNLVNPQSQVNAPVVFVGYGVSAPELNYDDYAQVNVKGKIVMYVGSAPNNFADNEGAYFASELAKHSTAAAKGAVGIITIVAGDENRTTWNAVLKRNRKASTAGYMNKAKPIIISRRYKW